jgi:hypothetical protein
MFIHCQVPKYRPKKKRKAKPVLFSVPRVPLKSVYDINKAYIPPAVYRRDTPNVPSFTASVVSANATKRTEPRKYTGTLIKGIATMHKSNAVPVINEEQMKDISRMRRG